MRLVAGGSFWIGSKVVEVAQECKVRMKPIMLVRSISFVEGPSMVV